MDFYQSCMNTDKINALGAEPLLKVISENGNLNALLYTPYKVHAPLKCGHFI